MGTAFYAVDFLMNWYMNIKAADGRYIIVPIKFVFQCIEYSVFVCMRDINFGQCCICDTQLKQ